MNNSNQGSYNETMNRWASHQKFWWRFWHLYLVPTPYASFGARCLGFAWRLAIVLALAAVVYFQVIKWRAASAATTARFQNALREVAGVDVLESDSLQWDDRLSLTKLRMEGTQGMLFHEWEMRGISMNKPPWYGASSDVWDLGRISAWDAAFAIRISAKTPVSQSLDAVGSSAAKGLDLRFNEIDVSRVSGFWGENPAMRGSLEGTRFRALKGDSGWEIGLREGSLALPWLPPLLLDSLSFMLQKGQATFKEDSSFHFAEGGTGRLSGGFAWNESGARLHLGILLQNVQADWFLPDSWKDILRTGGEVKLSLKGSLEKVSTGEMTFEAKWGEGSLDGLHAARFLGSRLRKYEFAKLGFTSATMTGAVSPERGLEIHSLSFMERSLKVKVEAKGKVQGAVASGELRFGVPPVVFAGDSEVAKLGEVNETDGLVWITIPLSGAPAELSKGWTDRQVAASRATETGLKGRGTDEGLIQPRPGQPPASLPDELQ